MLPLPLSPTLCPGKLFEVLQQMFINKNAGTLVTIKLGQISKSPWGTWWESGCRGSRYCNRTWQSHVRKANGIGGVAFSYSSKACWTKHRRFESQRNTAKLRLLLDLQEIDAVTDTERTYRRENWAAKTCRFFEVNTGAKNIPHLLTHSLQDSQTSGLARNTLASRAFGTAHSCMRTATKQHSMCREPTAPKLQ